MITYTSKLTRKDQTTGKEVHEFKMKGLQADTKPTTESDGMIIGNGSTFMEIDGDKFFMFDEENGEWKDKTS